MSLPRAVLRLLAASALAALCVGCQVGSADIGQARLSVRYLDREEAEFLRLINEYRTANDVGTLTSSATINQAAHDHSEDMGERGYFEHATPEGLSPWDRMCAAGYDPACTGGTAMGENIAAGNEGAYDTFEQWRGSPPHNENMLTPSFVAIGIGRAFVPGSPLGWYWTNDFGGILDVDGCACAAGARETCATPSCGGGVRDCDGHCQWSECYVPSAGPEICDGYDNDCNGEVDEDGICGSCVPADEVCNGDDDDCDGRVDENRVCGPACSPDGEAEACDGNDNDCDGVIDEGCACPAGAPARSCGVASGRCTTGAQTCEGGAWSACPGATLPRREFCDGIDNDCDGRIDEDVCDVVSPGGDGCSVAPARGRGGVAGGAVAAIAAFLAILRTRRRPGVRLSPGRTLP